MNDNPRETIETGKAYVDDHLAHFTSAYYDPVKAHAYYEEHKKLKGRAAKSALTSSKQREIWAVEQENIRKAKSGEITKVQKTTKANVKAMHEAAQKTVDEIGSTLKALAQQLKNDSAHLPEVNTIPKDATPQQRAFLEAQNRTIKANAKKAINTKYKEAAGSSARQRAKIVGDLSRAINDAGNAYSNQIATINVKYAKISTAEKQKIHDSVPGAPPPKAKTKHK